MFSLHIKYLNLIGFITETDKFRVTKSQICHKFVI
jgi:hypothetical protein